MFGLQLRNASHQHLDLLVAVIPVSTLVIMMILGLLPLAVGRLVKISGTIRESIDWAWTCWAFS